MKRTLQILSIILIFNALSYSLKAQDSPQLDNSGFEQWTSRSENAVSEPVHWHSGGTATGTWSGFVSSQIEQSTQTRPGSNGSKSVRLYPDRILGVTANGNITNGRMNAGSMSATGSGNYNYTQRSNSEYNTPINSVPDSLVVWVCFRSQSSTDKAQIHAVVHGDADYKLIADGTEEPANMKVANALLSFTRTSTANGAYTWRRLSIPFVKNGPCSDPRYLLFTATTNETPGHGSTNDDLLIDDIELVYNPTTTMEMATSYSVYPNPFFSTVEIDVEKTVKNIEIYDVYGRLVKDQPASGKQIELDLCKLAAGVYLLQLDYGDSKSLHRIIKASH